MQFSILISKFIAGPVLHSHYFAGETSILCRYASGTLPKRDIEFMQSVKKILTNGLDVVRGRDDRAQMRKTVISL